MPYIVYMHTCPNGKTYVGITQQEAKRRWNNGRGYIGNEYFTRAIKKYGWANIKHEILFENLTKQEAAEKEIELIAMNKSDDRRYGYNQNKGGFDNHNRAAEKPLPPFCEVLKNPAYLHLLADLLKLCRPQKVIETITVEEYEMERLVKKETKSIERIIEPNIVAMNEIVNSYEDDPDFDKKTIEKLKEMLKIADE